MRIKKKNIIFEQRVKSNLPIPKEVKQLYDLFSEKGFELYIVGGAVRDTLLGKPIKDYDLATDLPAPKVAKLLDDNGIRNIGTGAEFGVINAFIGDEEYEIATFRVDSKEGDGRRPDSVTFTDIETDVKRRDLTINALFYDIGTKEIIDLVGGIDDIKNGVVRTVGEPKERFSEDRLRILRAIRFAARVGSNLDSSIDKQLKVDSSLEGISAERIRDEFIKGIKSAKSVKQFLGLLNRYGLFDWVFKGLTPINKNFPESSDEILVISTLLLDVPYDKITKGLNKLTYSVSEVKQVTFLLSFYQIFEESTFYTLKKLHLNSKVPDDTFRAFANEVDIDINLVNRFIKFNLSVTGDEVKQRFGIEAGPEMGKKIKELETEMFFSS
tara:strand:- start:4924 stop:6072 length:1149 start_codon:yes stop_codon:yes gene_type:complete